MTLQRLLICLFFSWLSLLSVPSALAQQVPVRATESMQYWIDAQGSATVEDVMGLSPSNFAPLEGAKAQQLGATSAMWLRYELPQQTSQFDRYLKLEGPPFMNRISLYQRDTSGKWVEQRAGDHLPNAQWSYPAISPNFKLESSTQGVVWLRIQEFPSPSRPTLSLIDENDYRSQQLRGLLLIGCYFGFCLLVLYLGVVYWRLHRDSVFVSYVAYVACMIGLQLCFTGVGQAVFWRSAGAWNDVIIACFAQWVVATGLWFVRQVIALQRHSPRLNQFVKAWCVFGFVFPLVYALSISPTTLRILNLYGIASVILSIAITLWTWKKGESYGKWATLAFLPLHLAYIFPGLRLAGVVQDGWVTQYAFLIGSAIEIPALLYLLHRRAKEFGENAARMQSVRSTDALTGLPILPVLELRLGDAMERAKRQETQCAFLIVELQNYAAIVNKEGRLAGEQALVLMASRLQDCARSIDTVCRLGDTRMGILIEPPVSTFKISELAQSIVTKGLMRLSNDPQEITHVYCIGTIALPFHQTSEESPALDAQSILNFAQEQLGKVPVTSSRKIFKLPLTDGDLADFAQSSRRPAAESKPVWHAK
jgi:two-component system, sensor histidine kinase LadS